MSSDNGRTGRARLLVMLRQPREQARGSRLDGAAVGKKRREWRVRVRVELGQLVEEEHAEMGERSLAGVGRVPSPTRAAMLAE